jgi:hypothetical protein
MPTPRLVAIPCKLLPGLFSSERVFVVKMADEKDYTGTAPIHFCWNAEGKPLSGPPKEEDGLVAGKGIDELDEQQVAVEVPDGEVIAVDAKSIKPRPTEIRPPSPLAPSEPKPHVPV